MKQAILVAGLCAAASVASAAPRGETIDDMLAMQRVGEPAISPDGKWAAFSVRDTDIAANRGRFDLWMVRLDGGAPRRLTTNPENDTDPRWSRDGRWIYFLSARSGSSQVWKISPFGGEAQQVTNVPVDINGFELFPDEHLLLAIDVYPDAHSLGETAKRDADRAKSKVKARIYDHLLFRHWDVWEDGKFSHLFAWRSDRDVRDLTPKLETDTPIHPFGGMEEVAISPDGQWVAYTARAAGRANAWTPNSDIYLVPAAGGSTTDLTAKNLAYDFDPTFSPDGKSLAIRMLERPGFESDRARLAVIDLASKRLRVVTEGWDRSPSSVSWSADSRALYTVADNVGNASLFAVDVASGAPRLLVDHGTSEAPHDAGGQIVFLHDTLKQPAELFSVRPDGSELHQITHFNDERVKHIAWGDYEQFAFTGAHGDTVHGYVIKPANWHGQRVPVAFLIHGGPQGSFGDHYHYRWNPEVFAGHGYGVVMIDFHGSTGYGQAFTDAISGDWGGAPFEDLMKGLDAALAKYKWLDGKRAVALGASYGGYMINWLNGHTDRFRALICHDGVFDTRMMYFSTEEMWFPTWEQRGTPWEQPENYAKVNPSEFVGRWKTPELVIHGALDYRIPETQGMGAFSALQRRGIPSKFIEFPDEDHFVLKPQNSELWHYEVLAWMDRWTH